MKKTTKNKDKHDTKSILVGISILFILYFYTYLFMGI